MIDRFATKIAAELMANGYAIAEPEEYLACRQSIQDSLPNQTIRCFAIMQDGKEARLLIKDDRELKYLSIQSKK